MGHKHHEPPKDGGGDQGFLIPLLLLLMFTMAQSRQEPVEDGPAETTG